MANQHRVVKDNEAERQYWGSSTGAASIYDGVWIRLAQCDILPLTLKGGGIPVLNYAPRAIWHYQYLDIGLQGVRSPEAGQACQPAASKEGRITMASGGMYASICLEPAFFQIVFAPDTAYQVILVERQYGPSCKPQSRALHGTYDTKPGNSEALADLQQQQQQQQQLDELPHSAAQRSSNGSFLHLGPCFPRMLIVRFVWLSMYRPPPIPFLLARFQGATDRTSEMLKRLPRRKKSAAKPTTIRFRAMAQSSTPKPNRKYSVPSTGSVQWDRMRALCPIPTQGAACLFVFDQVVSGPAARANERRASPAAAALVLGCPRKRTVGTPEGSKHLRASSITRSLPYREREDSTSIGREREGPEQGQRQRTGTA
ncbi:hypothetical protein SCAR479_09909 [Seiridium cardinale]|uniref:Uncharacterized protein n=1 Tax=Seiridium cardinale TaxID=138064 RepID=A0ABR2XHZ1_9PEZI